jgi:cation diffusion facilitator CzcD-associated flavoprotein CzcO
VLQIDFLIHSADLLNQNIRTSTKLDRAFFNKEDKIWTLHIARDGSKETLKTPHFVLAIGAGGTVPVMPQLPNRVSCPNNLSAPRSYIYQDQFKGVVIHSVEYKHSNDWKGSGGLVIGSANTGKKALG